jgi:hypothetical protein
VPGEQQRHHLVAYLHVVQPVAVLVLGVEQQAENVPAAPAGRAAVGYLGVDQGVELAGSDLHARPRRALSAEHPQQVVARVERQRLLEQAGGVDRPGPAAVRVQPEQGTHRDPHREVARPVVQVDRRSRLELLDRPLGLRADRIDGGGDVVTMERGQHDAAGAAMEVAVDRQQPVPHQSDQVAEAAFAPLEVGGMRDEDVVVGGGAEHEDDVAVKQAQREDRAEALVTLEQHLERVLGEAARAQQREARFPRGVGNPSPALVTDVVEHH